MLHNGKTFIYVVKDYYILDPEYICGGDRNGGIVVFCIDFSDGSVFSVVAEDMSDLFSGRYRWSVDDPGKVFPMLFRLLNMYPEMVVRKDVRDLVVVPYGSKTY